MLFIPWKFEDLKLFTRLPEKQYANIICCNEINFDWGDLKMQMSSTYMSRGRALSHPCLSLLCPDWLISQSVRGGGLKDGGLIKADYEGESVLASHSDHHSDGFIMEAPLHPPPLSPRPPSAVVHLPRRTTCWQVGERLTNRDRDDVLPCCCWFLTPLTL